MLKDLNQLKNESNCLNILNQHLLPVETQETHSTKEISNKNGKMK